MENDEAAAVTSQGPLTAKAIIERLGDAVHRGPTFAEEIRSQIMLYEGLASLAMDVDSILATVNSNLGYLCGYLPAEYANMLLEWLNVEHPIFGKKIDISADQAFEAGRRVAEDYEARRRKQETLERKRAAAAKGMDIPDPGETVSSESADKLLKALREAKNKEK